MQERFERLREAVDRMIEADRLHRAVCDRELSEIGIHRAQHRMLMHLYFHGDVPSQRELARELCITPAVVTVTLRKLESDGYVRRTSVTDDKRQLGVELTESGRAVIGRTKVILDRVDRAMFDGFTEEELETACQFYARIKENLGKIGGNKI